MLKGKKRDRLITEKVKEKIPDFPNISELKHVDRKSAIQINDEEFDFEVKYDGAFVYNKKYLLYEIKGYGDDTNSILSSIMAGQLLNEIPEYRNHRYYYIGINSGLSHIDTGFQRNHFFDKNRPKITPYTKWAESKNIIRFYGIVDILVLLNDMKQFCLHH